MPGATGPVAMKTRIYTELAERFNPLDASLAFALGYLVFWVGVMAILHRKRWHVRV